MPSPRSMREGAWRRRGAWRRCCGPGWRRARRPRWRRAPSALRPLPQRAELEGAATAIAGAAHTTERRAVVAAQLGEERRRLTEPDVQPERQTGIAIGERGDAADEARTRRGTSPSPPAGPRGAIVRARPSSAPGPRLFVHLR